MHSGNWHLLFGYPCTHLVKTADDNSLTFLLDSVFVQTQVLLICQCWLRPESAVVRCSSASGSDSGSDLPAEGMM